MCVRLIINDWSNEAVFSRMDNTGHGSRWMDSPTSLHSLRPLIFVFMPVFAVVPLPSDMMLVITVCILIFLWFSLLSHKVMYNYYYYYIDNLEPSYVQVNVCQKHLYLLHRAFLCYVSGNHQGVSNILQRCHFTKQVAAANHQDSAAESISLKS